MVESIHSFPRASSSTDNSPTYQRRKPEQTVLYKIVQQNLASFLALVEAETGRALPEFVIKEFRNYLKCGILAHGFLRNVCESCKHENLVAFSCKQRGFCPSCGVRRMAETAADLVDNILPDRPYRQWVITFPVQLRPLLAIRPKIMARLLSITHSCIANYYRIKSGLTKPEAKIGAVTFIQNFGGQINLNVHFHQLFIDGCCKLNKDLNNEDTPLEFYQTPAPTKDELNKGLAKIIERIVRYLERQEILIKDDEDQQIHLTTEEQNDPYLQIQAKSSVYRFATGPNKGKKALVLGSDRDEDHRSKAGAAASIAGFSLHAAVAIKHGQRDKLEKLCRYISRPAVAESRLFLNTRGEVIYKLKTPYSDGTTHVVMSQMELMEKLAAIVPRPRVHLTRYHGILAPHSKHRKSIIRRQRPVKEKSPDHGTAEAKSNRIGWAKLLKRVYKFDVEICSKCQGRMRIVANIEDPKIIKKILSCIGLDSEPPEPFPARGPPDDFSWEYNQDENQTHFH